MEEGGELHAAAALPPGEKPGVHCTGGCADPRVVVDVLKKRSSLAPPGILAQDRPAHSLFTILTTLHRLQYIEHQNRDALIR
jgi:hypothetical protein